MVIMFLSYFMALNIFVKYGSYVLTVKIVY